MYMLCLSVYLSACLYHYLNCLSVCLPVCMCVCLCTCVPVCQSIYLSRLIYLPVFLSACLSVSLSVYDGELCPKTTLCVYVCMSIICICVVTSISMIVIYYDLPCRRRSSP